MNDRPGRYAADVARLAAFCTRPTYTVLLFGMLTAQLLAASPAAAFSWSRGGSASVEHAGALSDLLQASVGPRIEIEGGQIRFADPSQGDQSKGIQPNGDQGDGTSRASSLLDLTAAWLGSLTGLSMKGLIIEKPTLVLRLDGETDGQATGRQDEPGPLFSDEILALALRPALEAIGRFKFESLKVVDGRVRIVRADGSEEVISAFNAELRSGTGSQILVGRGEFTLRGRKLDFDGSLGKPVGASSKPDGFPLVLRVGSELLSTSFDGRLSIADGLQQEGRISVAAPDMKAVARWLGQAMPEGGGFGALKIDADFKWTGNRMTFEGTRLSLDGNAGFGAMTVDISQMRPALDGTLAFDTLDLSPYGLTAWQGGLASLFDRLIDTEWLQFADADLRISAGEVLIGEARAGRMAASVSLTAGTLLGDLVELEAFEGVASGQFEMEPDPNGVRIALRGRLSDGDLRACSKLLLGDQLIAGTGTLNFDLSGRGSHFAAMLGSLKGQFALDIPSSGRIGIDLKRLMDVAPGKPAGKAMTGWADYRGEMSRFDALQAQFKIDGGRATGEGVRVKLGGKELRAGGSIDMAQQRLNLRLQIGDAADSAGAAPSLSASQTAVILEGAWDAPSIFVQ